MSSADARLPSVSVPDSWWLAALALVAMALRGIAWSRAGIMFNDGPAFIELAQAVSVGDWGSVVAHPYHPLYPISLAALHGVVGGLSWDDAGALVSVVAAGLCVPVLFYLLRGEFGRNAAWIGVLLFVSQSRSVAFFSDVMSDGLYCLLFLSAVLCALRGRAEGGIGWYVGVGAASGLAYLTRPEGLGPLGLAGAFLLWDGLRKSVPAPQMLAWGSAMVIVAGIVAAPYLLALQEHSGELTLTQKKTVAQVGGSTFASGPTESEGQGPSGPEKLWIAADELIGSAASGGRIEWLLPLALGVWWCRGRPSARGAWFLALVGLYGLVLYGLSLDSGYVSKRHAFPIWVALLGYAGLGLIGLVDRAAARFGGSAHRLSVILVGGLVALSLLPQLSARREDRLAIRRAAEWLAAEVPSPSGPVAAEKRRVAYYADAPFVLIKGKSDAADFARAQGSGAAYLVSESEGWAPFVEAGRLVLLHASEHAGEVARVYRFEDPE